MIQTPGHSAAASRTDWAVVGAMAALAAGALLALACALWRACAASRKRLYR
jgi:hypothetical protein